MIKNISKTIAKTIKNIITLPIKLFNFCTKKGKNIRTTMFALAFIAAPVSWFYLSTRFNEELIAKANLIVFLYGCFFVLVFGKAFYYLIFKNESLPFPDDET